VRERGSFNATGPKNWDFFSIRPRGLKITESGGTAPRRYLGIEYRMLPWREGDLGDEEITCHERKQLSSTADWSQPLQSDGPDQTHACSWGTCSR